MAKKKAVHSTANKSTLQEDGVARQGVKRKSTSATSSGSAGVYHAESVAASTLADQPSSEDRFNFKPYVEAVAAFLSSTDTQPPLSMSIEGEWGSGKTSFMLQLEKWLGSHSGTVVVRFNPWRIDTGEAVWADFALCFVDQMNRALPWRARLNAKWQLLAKQFDWGSGWCDVLRFIARSVLWTSLITAAIVFWWYGVLHYPKESSYLTTGSPAADSTIMALLYASGIAGPALGVIMLFRSATKYIGNPLKVDLGRHLKRIDYADKVSFCEQFHKDFKTIVDVYASAVADEVSRQHAAGATEDTTHEGNAATAVRSMPIFVFIDDLDRCDAVRAADLMQSINMLISDDPRLIFVLGLDREKVAAGLAVRHEKVLPYLSSSYESHWRGTEEERNRVSGIRYGYDYLEKFIQLPFRLPRPTPRDVQTFLDYLGSSDRPVGQHDESQSPQYNWDSFEFTVGADSEAVHAVVHMVAPALNNNPRRLIQFINVFRLRAYIAARTGLFNLRLDGSDSKSQPLTMEQLAKFIAIGLRWPTFMIDLVRHRNDLLQLLEEKKEFSSLLAQSDNAMLAAAYRWAQVDDLRTLLRYGLTDSEPTDPQRFELSKVDLSMLLEIAPAVARPFEGETTGAKESWRYGNPPYEANS